MPPGSFPHTAVILGNELIMLVLSIACEGGIHPEEHGSDKRALLLPETVSTTTLESLERTNLYRSH